MDGVGGGPQTATGGETGWDAPDLPRSMLSNSFSSPVMRGMRVQGLMTLVATA